MSQNALLVHFLLDGQKYALHHPVVERVLNAVEITPLPRAPKIVLGIINMHGQVIPVLNIRQRFGLAERPLRLSDQFIIATTAQRVVALLVDNVVNVVQYAAEQMTTTGNVVNGTAYISAVAKDSDGLTLIHDLDTFLSLDESSQLDSALNQLG